MPARIQVESPTRALSGLTNTYLVGSDDALLVDPAGRSAELDRAIEERSGAERSVRHVAVTHHHPDHVGAVAEYADEYGLTVWARRGREAGFKAATGIPPEMTFGPGEEIPAAEGIRVIDTPGHAPEHVAFEADGGLLTGDLAVASGSVVVGAPEGDMRAYLTSLRRILARNPDRLFPAHGPVIDDPPATCERLLRHRLQRESLVRQAVIDGVTTPKNIVDAVYEKDVSDVYELATATVVAHLEKLAVEGDLRWDGETAELESDSR